MYSLQPGPSPFGYGYWPWFTEQSRARGWPAITTTVLFDDGKGPYADYPYTGPLPSYPANAPPPNGQPRPSFVFAPSAPRVASAVQFDASASTDDQGIVQYRWDFGDGQAGTGAAGTVSTVKPRTAKSEPRRPALEEQPSEAPDESVTGEQADQEIDELFRDLDEMEASTARASEGIEAEDSPVATRPKKR